jgi:hypothetical protein
MVKLGNYNNEKQAQETLKANELKLLRDNVLSVIRQIEDTLLSDVVDMYDTFYYLKKNDKTFADDLWSKYLTKSEKIDVNSYFGFRAEGTDYYFHITITKNGVGCYYSHNKNEWVKDGWRTPYDIKGELDRYDKEQLDNLLKSALLLTANLPAYIEGFFKCVSERRVPNKC